MIHILKIKPEYFEAVIDGRKSFEVRKKDREYSVGDELLLREINNGFYTGRELRVKVSYILDNPGFCKKDFVIMGICTIRDITDVAGCI